MGQESWFFRWKKMKWPCHGRSSAEWLLIKYDQYDKECFSNAPFIVFWTPFCYQKGFFCAQSFDQIGVFWYILNLSNVDISELLYQPPRLGGVIAVADLSLLKLKIAYRTALSSKILRPTAIFELIVFLLKCI